MLALLLAAPLANSCQRAPSDQAFAGLLRSDTGFLLSPDRCELSMLFDNFRIETPAPKHHQQPDRMFEIAGGGGKAVTVDVRGALTATYAAKGQVAVSIAGQTIRRDVTAGEHPFGLRYVFRLPAGAPSNRVRIETSLAPSPAADQSAALDVDSLDMALPAQPPCK
jgi:hypothetical protein